MALINCPECGKSISDKAETCPTCGYSIKEYIIEKERLAYISYLTSKIKPCEFTVPEPRVKVCIRCTYSILPDGRPTCSCNMPSVEIDFPEQQNGSTRSGKYILHNCILPRNIGDPNCKEFQDEIEYYEQHPEIIPYPPDPKYFGDYGSKCKSSPTPTYTPPTNTPTCPICQSTNLTKISTVKKASKIALFGILGAGDVGKTYKCNKCGSKF